MAVLSVTDKKIAAAAVRRYQPGTSPVPAPLPPRPHARGDGRLKRVERARTGRCVYCALPTTGRACHGHADLRQLDPHYNGLV